LKAEGICVYYLYAYMVLCHHAKGSVFSCGLQMTDAIGSHSCSWQ